MERQNNLIVRYRPGDRFIHWVVAVSFILAGLGGLAMYHPMFVPLSALFGGGPQKILKLHCGVLSLPTNEECIDRDRFLHDR